VASLELPERVCELARELGRDIASVTVRDQRSRWGSCSPTGTISLNWRLIQMPPDVADYVIYHELAHVEHANHSRRFWRLVRRVCPWTDQARAWLRRHGTDLL
jgi:predicted metal-dependent hydrolase